nr:MAG: DNA-binding protein [Thermoproteus sp. AZ2]
MLNSIEVEIGEKRYSGDLAPLTFISGTGKSTIIYIIYKILKNINSSIPKLFDKYKIILRVEDKKYSLEKRGNFYRQVLEGDGVRVVFEARPPDINRIIEPFELSVRDAGVVMPFVEVAEHVSMLADEEVERVNKAIAEFRKAFAQRALLLGPYLRPRSRYDTSRGRAELRPDGSNIVGVLSSLALDDPAAYDRIRASFRKKGITIALGLLGKNALGAAAYAEGLRMPLSRLPCSLKSALVIATAISLRPDIILIDNFDYCFTEAAAEILSPYIAEYVAKGQLIAEIHRADIADYFKTQYKSIISASL